MFVCITAINDEDLNEIIMKKFKKSDKKIEDIRFEITFLKQLALHSENLLRAIDETCITGVIKKQICKVTSLLVQGYNTRLNGFLNDIQKELSGSDLNALESTQIMKNSTINEYSITLNRPVFPSMILTQIGGIHASCGLHSVMHMLLSAGFSSNFFDFTVLEYQKAFAVGFNRLNNGEMCTIMSEINDVLRSFADTIASFVPPKKLYAMVSTKGKNIYNFCDFLKPSVKVNYGLRMKVPSICEEHKRDSEMTIKESLIYDIRLLQPEWILFDIGIWTYIINSVPTNFTAGGCKYGLHSFILNTGYHYVCCVVDKNTNPTTVRIYDDLCPGTVHVMELSKCGIDNIGALMFYRIN